MSTDEDVAAFLYLYEKIQTSTKGNLNQIGFLYRNNESFRAACCDLHWKASILRRRVEDSGDKVIENVDPKFIARWRNYHRDISPKIDPLVSADFLKGLGLGIDEDALSEDELDAKTAEHPIDPVNEEVVEKLQMIRTRYEIGNSERIPDIEMMSEHKLMEG